VIRADYFRRRRTKNRMAASTAIIATPINKQINPSSLLNLIWYSYASASKCIISTSYQAAPEAFPCLPRLEMAPPPNASDQARRLTSEMREAPRGGTIRSDPPAGAGWGEQVVPEEACDPMGGRHSTHTESEVAVNRVAIVGCFAILSLMGGKPTTQPIVILSDRIGNGVSILGKLGLPVGQETTIKGRKHRDAPGSNWFLVETIDGKPAPANLHVWVRGTGKWPDGTKATLRGGEIGTLHYSTIANYAPDDPRWKEPSQELHLEFDANEVVEPRGRRLRDNCSCV
jgi:hypothetical protein